MVAGTFMAWIFLCQLCFGQLILRQAQPLLLPSLGVGLMGKMSATLYVQRLHCSQCRVHLSSIPLRILDICWRRERTVAG